jgi:hypothetical protein
MRARESQNQLWRPPPHVRAAINRGDRVVTEYHKRAVAEAEAARLARLERRQ